jgi:hypothetical protein
MEPIIASICLLINCPDTKTVARVLPMARQVIGVVHNTFDSQMATTVLIHCIRSLQVNGADEVCNGPLLGLTFMVYSWLRPNHPAVLNVLTEIPDLPAKAITDFDERIMNMFYKNESVAEKQRRDSMRKILKSVIAVSLDAMINLDPHSSAETW